MSNRPNRAVECIPLQFVFYQEFSLKLYWSRNSVGSKSTRQIEAIVRRAATAMKEQGQVGPRYRRVLRRAR